MVIQQKLGILSDFNINGRSIDYVMLEWYETNKRILHKKSVTGKDIVFRFLDQSPLLTENDVVYEDQHSVVLIQVLPCEVISVQPGTIHEAAAICYEIGNRHLPLFFENNELMIPFEKPVYHLLEAAGYGPVKQMRKLLYPLKTSVSPHQHSGSSLFSKILKLTTNTNE